MSIPRNIDYLITGGTGLIGQAFIESLRGDLSVVVLSREEKSEVTTSSGVTIYTITSLHEIYSESTIKTIINLSGAPIIDKRWSPSRKREIEKSRIDVTYDLAQLSYRISEPVGLLISGSAIGYYGDTGAAAVDEQAEQGLDFSAKLCGDWEVAAQTINAKRICISRTGLVLSSKGGLLKKLELSYKLGLGAAIGSGQQMMSWIHIDDMTGVLNEMISNAEYSGTYNLTAPNPVTNEELSDQLAGTLHRLRLFSLPTPAVKMIFGPRASLLLDSQYVLPKRLLDQAYSFKYPKLEAALGDIYQAKIN